MTANDTISAINPLPFTILPIVGAEEIVAKQNKKTEMVVHPNPSGGKIFIKFSTPKNRTEINVYDNAGNFIRNLFRTKGSGEFTIYWDRKDFKRRIVPAGTYFIELKNSEGKKITQKIVITD
jgi:flagellar hook assembly protein FlgD